MNKVQLNTYKVTIEIGASKITQLMWYFINIIIFKSSLPFPSSFKGFILKLFGADLGKGIRFKPCINIKYPWKLSIGDDCWVGEQVWIDNLEPVRIGSNCCLSQGTLLLTGSHDAMRSSFDYTSGLIILEDGVWLGAKSIVTSGVTCGLNSVLGAGSVADRNLEKNVIYKGNPAIPVLKRAIK
ncbi:MAG: WcaF family extracellular polysaccharide biosynthesis acetyltransferase [Chitinophagaceae bacterium]|jgi:putative colanic acid biosynthesis acetyltransferase WcaF